MYHHQTIWPKYGYSQKLYATNGQPQTFLIIFTEICAYIHMRSRDWAELTPFNLNEIAPIYSALLGYSNTSFALDIGLK